ncbi:IS4 family transposase [Alteromonas ponticola]|uniref:IS4 family transposase n=1 Tax=Alteromonas aquimaris TaxID=2998417 RepID=A0ABT3P3H6_9ALTE|nr:IS4 family transposase [Alteromonas aquimaris]MCW8107100.1 IS4 family transposase [Alteromonas aquimaris]
MLIQELTSIFEEDKVRENIDVFNAPLPTEFIEQAISLTSSVSVRRRKLPPEQVLRLVVGMSLMRHESIQEVATRLAFSSKGLTPDLLAARSSLSNARQRLGSEPVKWLFERSAEHWANQTHVDDNWLGLQPMAIDGTTLRTEDTPECREHFGSAATSGEFESGYPVMQLTCLMNVRSHIILRAEAGKYRDSELYQTTKMLESVPDNSVLLMDKLYHSAKLLPELETNGQNRFWVTPVRKDIKYTVTHTFTSNDQLVERDLSSARRKDKSLPRHWSMRLISFETSKKKVVKLATNLPHDAYSAEDIIALYKERWEIELGYREVKTSMLNNALTLRSKKVDLVYQELYVLLLAYNLIRHEIALTANEVGIRPTRISFKSAMRIVLYDYYGMAMTNSLHTLPARMKDLTEAIKDFILPKPERPAYPRVLKLNNAKRYPLKKPEKLRKKP